MRAQTSLREALWLHLLFFAAAVPVLLLAEGSALGKGVLLLAIAYNLAVPMLGVLRGHNDWLSLWWFLLPLSCAQVLPDWALVEIAQTLYFPDHGIYRIGDAVPLYFMGMWIMLLFPLLLLSEATGGGRYLTVAALAAVLFAFWEWAAAPLQLWQGRDVTMVHGIALYALVAEVMLAVAALWMYRSSRGRDPFTQVLCALSVPVFYTGALFVALLLMERS